jgi:hypothetical protein
MNNRNYAVLTAIALVLFGLAPPSAADSDCVDLLARLRDQEKGQRLAAIDALGELRDSRAIDPLGATLLDSGEDEDVRRACAKSLGKIGDIRTAQVFVKFLLIPPSGTDTDRVARVYAAMSLGQMRVKFAVDALLKNIDPSRESDLNYHCVVALGRIADPDGLRSLLPIVRKGLPVWTASPWTRTSSAAYWALLPLDPGLARQFYLDRWNGASSLKGKADVSVWFSALFLLSDAGTETSPAEKKAWEAYLNRELGAAAAVDCAMVGEAIDHFPISSLLASVAALLKDLDFYPKSWLAGALIHHPEPSMIPAFRALLDCEDDYLVYAGLASMDHLIAQLPSPLTLELRARLVDFRAKLPALSPAQIAGGTKEWRDVVQKRLDSLLDSDP